MRTSREHRDGFASPGDDPNVLGTCREGLPCRVSVPSPPLRPRSPRLDRVGARTEWRLGGEGVVFPVIIVAEDHQTSQFTQV